MKASKQVRNVTASVALAAALMVYSANTRAEVKLLDGGESGWTVSTDGRVNAFVSHIWGDNRAPGLESLNWVGFNESTDEAQATPDNNLDRTRIRSGYVPSNFGLMASKQASKNLKVLARVEIGVQITTRDPSSVGDHTWMEPRDTYFDLSGNWGGLRAGRALGLFGRGNLFMNYELGHAYGLGFPCSYDQIFGGACGHVGFGTIYPDHRAQISYSTPKLGDVVQVTAGIFDPRTIPTKGFVQTRLPRVEGEATADYHWTKGWGVKAWVNGLWQKVGTTGKVADPTTMVVSKQTFSLTALGVGGGLQGDLGPIQLGATGHSGKGMDGFLVFTFNPIFVGLAPKQAYLAEFRPTKAFLLHAVGHIADGWVSVGYGKTMFDRVATDPPMVTLDAAPLLRSQTGISTGGYYRFGQVVAGIDYFRADYGFDKRYITPPPGAPAGATAAVVQPKQVVNILNVGATVEW